MTELITYKAASGFIYEIKVSKEIGQYSPIEVTEDYKGEIKDMQTGNTWPSLLHMSHDLKLEIISWGSDVGD